MLALGFRVGAADVFGALGLPTALVVLVALPLLPLDFLTLLFL